MLAFVGLIFSQSFLSIISHASSQSFFLISPPMADLEDQPWILSPFPDDTTSTCVSKSSIADDLQVDVFS